MTKNRVIGFLAVFASLAVMTALSGCGRDYLYEPTFHTSEQIHVKQEDYANTYELSALTEAALHNEASRFMEKGDGALDITVTYDKGGSMDAMAASSELSQIAGYMQESGIDNVVSNVMPVASGATPKVLFRYTSYTAQRPKDCKRLDEMSDTSPDDYRNYKQGCTIESLIASQIARPKDLLGNAKLGTKNAMRPAVAVDGYDKGDPVSIGSVSTN